MHITKVTHHPRANRPLKMLRQDNYYKHTWMSRGTSKANKLLRFSLETCTKCQSPSNKKRNTIQTSVKRVLIRNNYAFTEASFTHEYLTRNNNPGNQRFILSTISIAKTFLDCETESPVRESNNSRRTPIDVQKWMRDHLWKLKTEPQRRFQHIKPSCFQTVLLFAYQTSNYEHGTPASKLFNLSFKICFVSWNPIFR